MRLRAVVPMLGLLVSCRTATLTPPDQYPALPASVETILGPVEVRLVKNLTVGEVKAWGAWMIGGRVILIEQSAPRPMQWLVLYHELCHVAYAASGLAYLTPPQHQEATCDAIASQRMRERFG